MQQPFHGGESNVINAMDWSALVPHGPRPNIAPITWIMKSVSLSWGLLMVTINLLHALIDTELKVTIIFR